MTSKSKTPQQQIQARGRPRLGSWRLETMLPQRCLDELIKRENESGVYRTRLAAEILCRELIGDNDVRSFTSR
jgi:hypothetical protein